MGITFHGEEWAIGLDCEKFEEWFSEYIESSLDEARKEVLEGHLRFCPNCANALIGVRQVKRAINELAAHSPSAVFQQNLDCFLQKERLGTSALRRRAVWGIALVAALTAFFWLESAGQMVALVLT